MTTTVVTHRYAPRAAFMAFHQRTQRFAVLVCHRRAGKTVAVVNDMVVRALRTKKPNAYYAYIAPFHGQAKQAAWVYVLDAVRDLPGVKVRESDSSVTFPNGAKLRVFGADNADAMRGLYFDGVCLDEFGDMSGRVWSEVIRPALADRRGWAVFIGTPRGKNKFFEMRNRAIEHPSTWFFLQLKASESGLLPQEELESAALDMDEDEYQQEFECSFDASIRGSYYGKYVAALEQKVPRAIRPIKVDPDEPVSLAMDIGFADALAIWFWQVIDGEVRFVDYFEQSGIDAEELLQILELKPYRWETWWLPHDAVSRTFASKKSVLDTFREHDAPARLVPRLDLKDGIDSARKTLRLFPVAFDEVSCSRGLEALKNYSRKYDPERKVFSNNPLHDQWSHGADAFRYASLVINHETIQRSVERGRAKRAARAGQRVPLLNTPRNSGWTFNDALADHDRRLAARRAAGRERI